MTKVIFGLVMTLSLVPFAGGYAESRPMSLTVEDLECVRGIVQATRQWAQACPLAPECSGSADSCYQDRGIRTAIGECIECLQTAKYGEKSALATCKGRAQAVCGVIPARFEPPTANQVAVAIGGLDSIDSLAGLLPGLADTYCHDTKPNYPPCDDDFKNKCSGTVSGVQGWGGQTCFTTSGGVAPE